MAFLPRSPSWVLHKRLPRGAQCLGIVMNVLDAALTGSVLTNVLVLVSILHVLVFIVADMQ